MVSEETYRDRTEALRDRHEMILNEVRDNYTELAKLEDYSFVKDALNEAKVTYNDPATDQELINLFNSIPHSNIWDLPNVDFFGRDCVETGYVMHIKDEDMIVVMNDTTTMVVSVEEAIAFGDLINVCDDMILASKKLKLNKFVTKL